MEIPEYVEDVLGQKVYPGDVIAYGTLLGRAGSISVGEVQGFSISKGDSPAVKIRIQGAERWMGKLHYKGTGLLIASYRRFVLLPNETKNLLPPRDNV